MKDIQLTQIQNAASRAGTVKPQSLPRRAHDSRRFSRAGLRGCTQHLVV